MDELQGKRVGNGKNENLGRAVVYWKSGRLEARGKNCRAS